MFLSSFVFTSIANAAPLYTPGQTLDPSCLPSNPDCTVTGRASSGINSDITQLSALTAATSTNFTVSNLFQALTGWFTNLLTTNATTTNLTVSSLTSGSIPFIGSGGTLSQNNSSFFWDNTNGRLGVGTTTPGSALSVAGNAFVSGTLTANTFSVLDASTTRSNLGLVYATPNDLYATSTTIATWGDSLTAGGEDGTGVTYPNVLHNISGYTVYNGGVGGQTSSQIASRMLADTSKYSWPTIIWAGQNDALTNTSDIQAIEANIHSMVAALTTSNYIILGMINVESTDEYIGQGKYNLILQINNDLATTFGAANSALPRGRIAMTTQLDGSYLSFGTTGNWNAGITNTALTINPAGKIGIGTTSPVSTLEVIASPYEQHESVPAVGTEVGAIFSFSNGQYGLMGGGLNSGTFYLQSQRFDGGSGVYPISLQPNGGSVGIGTTTPATALDGASHYDTDSCS